MGPLSILSRVSEDNWEIECSCNVRGQKCPLTTINREVDDSMIGDSPGCHSVIELNDHPGVEKPARIMKGSREYHCISHMESLSSGRATKLDMS